MHYSRTVHRPSRPLISWVNLMTGLSALFLLVACSAAPADSPNATAPSAEAPATGAPSNGSEAPTDGQGLTVKFAEVAPIIEQRCTACHANAPSITRFGRPAGGVLFETPEQIQAKADRIKARAVDTQSMPTGNLTEITDAERELLGRWIAQGASID